MNTHKPKAINPEVLKLINVGRRALGMSALTELPTGKPDDPEDSVLARALGNGIGIGCEDSACSYCGMQEFKALNLGSARAKALVKAWGTSLDRGFPKPFPVVLPLALARFEKEFGAWAYPELVDDPESARELAELREKRAAAAKAVKSAARELESIDEEIDVVRGERSYQKGLRAVARRKEAA